MNPVTVIEATAADRPSVMQLTRRATRVHSRFEIGDKDDWLDGWPFLLATAGGRLLGFVLCILVTVQGVEIEFLPSNHSIAGSKDGACLPQLAASQASVR
jgi:hypothetical protein